MIKVESVKSFWNKVKKVSYVYRLKAMQRKGCPKVYDVGIGNIMWVTHVWLLLHHQLWHIILFLNSNNSLKMNNINSVNELVNLIPK